MFSFISSLFGRFSISSTNTGGCDSNRNSEINNPMVFDNNDRKSVCNPIKTLNDNEEEGKERIKSIEL